jgi:hypothetical protein
VVWSFKPQRYGGLDPEAIAPDSIGPALLEFDEANLDPMRTDWLWKRPGRVTCAREVT